MRPRPDAYVARALVTIVLDEVSAKRLSTYGITAVQLSAKIERDPGAEIILTHLLGEAKPREVDKLLLHVLPSQYRRWHTAQLFDELPYKGLLDTLSRCFRAALEQASDETKRRVVAQFAQMLRADSADNIDSYESAFFRAKDLDYAAPSSLDLIKDHLLGRLKSANPQVLVTLEGIGKFLNAEDASNFIDELIKAVRDSSIHQQAVISFLENEYKHTSRDFDERINSRIEDWVRFLEQRRQEELGKAVAAIKLVFDDIPF